MRNETTLMALASELERNCGDELAAAKAVGVSLQFVYQWAKDDKAVGERLKEAARVGTQGLVSAAIKRAVHGVAKGVYFKGERVDEEIVYSDGLLQTLLKAKVPEFAKEGENGPVNVQVNVANVMPRATSYEQWLSMKDVTLKPALPAPSDADREASLGALGRLMCEPSADNVIEAEYVEIPSVPAFGGINL